MAFAGRILRRSSGIDALVMIEGKHKITGHKTDQEECG